MSVKYIPPSKNVGESVHDINENFAALDKQNEAIAQAVANKADAADVQDLAMQLNSKADTSDLEAKVSNDQSGATELLDNLIESETTPGNEDYLIIKSLKQYTLRPFTTLWNWIKSNLAKVATSGSYDDLSDKPDIPTVDSSFSESGTNAVAGNTILAALNSKANKTELQALSNQVSSKADKSELGTAAAKDVDTAVTSGSTNLVTSGGVSTALASYKPKNVKAMANTGGTAGYICFAQLVVTAGRANRPVEFTLLRRAAPVPCRVSIVFSNDSGTDPSISSLSVMGDNYGVYAYKSSTSTWQLYAQSPAYHSLTITDVNNDIKHGDGITITYPGTQVNTKHTTSTNNPVINASYGYRAGTANNAFTWNGLTDDTMTANTTDTRLMVLNGNKVQHRQIDTLPFLSSDDLAQPVLYTSTTTTASATITNLFANYSLVWFQVVGSKTTHTHILPLAYLKSKGSLTFKDSGTPINILYVSDTQIRWFEYQGQGAETYTSVTIVKII